MTSDHIPGNLNTAADVLSRNNLPCIIPFTCSAGPASNATAGSTGPCHQRPTRLGISSLDTTVHSLFDQGLSPASRAVYRTGWRRYLTFCEKHNITPLPLTELSQTAFAAFLSQTVSIQTVRSYLCALRFYPIRAGLPDPPCRCLPNFPTC